MMMLMLISDFLLNVYWLDFVVCCTLLHSLLEIFVVALIVIVVFPTDSRSNRETTDTDRCERERGGGNTECVQNGGTKMTF